MRIIFILSGLCLSVFSFRAYQEYKLNYPKSWPDPEYNFQKNPLSKAKIELGRRLFYDPILSADSSISCMSCHLQYTAFAHVDHTLSHGISDSIGTRNAPALMNLAWSKLFMWDGAVNHLDMQALAPISHPGEMGESLSGIIQKLTKHPTYPGLFYDAFKDSVITGEYLLKSISQFMLILVSSDSKYDQVQRNEAGILFTEQESRGYFLFRKNCESCHREPLFTHQEFANNGLKPDSFLQDPGRMRITLNSNDSLKFKVPTLRNIEYSFPYMHDGRFKTLSEVLKHYTSGIHKSPTLAPELQRPIILNSNEKVDLVSFLLTLSDKKFLFDTSYSYPKSLLKN